MVRSQFQFFCDIELNNWYYFSFISYLPCLTLVPVSDHYNNTVMHKHSLLTTHPQRNRLNILGNIIIE